MKNETLDFILFHCISIVMLAAIVYSLAQLLGGSGGALL